MVNTIPHPGTVVFIDGSTSRETNRVAICDLPPSMCFENTADGPIPVVKIVVHETDHQRLISMYGPNDEFLRSTVQLGGEIGAEEITEPDLDGSFAPCSENP